MQDSPPPLLPHEEGVPPRVDLWIAAAFLAIGLAIIVLSWQMPTYREQRGEIYTAPGLVPALYGIIISLLSIWLVARSLGRGALAPTEPAPPRQGYSNARLAAAAALCLFFTAGLIGRMPFWLAAAMFVTLFIVLFEWRRNLAVAVRLRQVAAAVLLGIVTGAAVTLVFERIFLVRLP